MRITTRKLLAFKQQNRPIVMLTAYDYPSAKLAEDAGVDIILVGDSLGMVVLGYESTVYVTLEDMVHHTKAVSRAAKSSMVISDIPYLLAHMSKETLLKAAGRLIQESGAYGIKIEGCAGVLENIRVLTEAGVPVMGHLGLRPQQFNQLGGYYVQGKNSIEAEQILDDAKSLCSAGIFALVLECVPEELAIKVARSLKIPVIGIGAGAHCDGQVLVLQDVLGLSEKQPSFAPSFVDAQTVMLDGITKYVQAVREQQFPKQNEISNTEHLYSCAAIT